MTEEKKEEKFEDNWVIVYTASNSHFAGKAVPTLSDKEDLTITLSPGFNWINESVMSGPGQMMLMRQPTPLGPTLESSVVQVQYIGIQYVDNWDKETKEDFFVQIKNIMKGMEDQKQKRALDRAGIVMAQPGVNPNVLRELQRK